jgi:peptidoglycan hydrolase-like protein with peptidoglycan-binding domain
MVEPARRLAPRLLALLGALVLLFAVAGQVAALSTSYPIQTVGNRGSDVRALQYLLREAGREVVVDGHFGPSTRIAVIAHQAATGFTYDIVITDESGDRVCTARLTCLLRGV